MKQKQVELNLLQALIACVVVIVATRMLGIPVVPNIALYLTFPLTVALWLWTMRRGVSKPDYLAVATVALAAICVLLDLWRSGGTLTMDYPKKLIMFAMTVIFLCVADRVQPGERLARFTQVLVDGLTVLMALMMLLADDRMHLINGKVTRYLTLGFSNPNPLAMLVTCMYMLTFCSLLKEQSVKQRYFRVAVLTAQIFILLGTRSRNGLLFSAVFTVAALAVLACEKVKNLTGITIKMHFRLWQAVAIAIFPMAFAVIYMAVVDAEWVEKLFSFMVSEGKGLNSRVKEWTPAFEAIKASPLFGAYYAISGGTGSSQMHNTHADTAASYGIPVMLLVSAILTFCIYQNGKTYGNKKSFLYMGAFCCAMLMGTFEAAFFSGGQGIYVFMAMFLILSKNVPDDEVDDGWYRVGQRLKQTTTSAIKRFKK